MNLKRKLLVMAAITAVVISTVIFQQNCKKAAEPNVVLIVLDTLRADHLPFYGYEKNTAPFLSEIVSRGVLFERAFAASSWTAPATASIFTALYPFQHGVTTGYWTSKFLKVRLNRIPGKIKTITEVLKEAGYKTYGVADNINICERLGFTRGFDRFKRFPYDEEWKMNPRLKEWSAEIKAQKKYFLYIHYNDCHTPLHKRSPWYKKKEDHLSDLISQYDSEISYVDTKIKEMYELFGWDKNTLLIITADHGEEHKERGRWDHGKTLYSEVIHVPFIICLPGKERAHKRVKVNVSSIDILPSLRHYLGIKSSESEAGVNLMPLIKGEKNELENRYIFSHLLKHSRRRDGKKTLHRATIFKEWKSIYVDKFRESHKKELYNLLKDPGERANIFRANQKLAGRLFIKFISFEKRCSKFKQETEEVKIDKKKMEELKSLGYVK